MLHVISLGDKRLKKQGLRVGVVRFGPMFKTKKEIKELYYDVRLPELAPSKGLLKEFKSDAISSKKFLASYRTEMKKTACKRLITLLAELSKKTDLSIGCYCEDEKQCHRQVLRKLMKDAGAKLK